MIKNEIIEHQFINQDFFFPLWKIDTLVLGTFNPQCGEQTDYFYGRCRNNFWRSIEELYNLEYMFFQNNLKRKLEFMRENKFGCADVIKSISKSNVVMDKEICGSGYSDQVLFNAQKCTITYQFTEIKEFLSNNNIKRVINTWGKRNNPSHFKRNIDDLESFCNQMGVEFIRICPSPSGRLKGENNMNKLSNFYKDNIFNQPISEYSNH